MMLSRVEAWRDILGLSLPTNLRSFHRSTHMLRQCATMEQMKHYTYGIEVQSDQYGSCQPFFHYKSLIFTRVWRHIG